MSSQPVCVFFSADDNYLPFLAVTLRSLIDLSDPARRYEIRVLHDGLSREGRAALRAMQTRNVRVGFCDMSPMLSPIRSMLALRDYYTPSIWSRLFIPTLFPNWRKAVYLDADIVLLRDVAELFDTPLNGTLLGAVTDEVVDDSPVFREFALRSLGLSRGRYFNSGVLVMNLEGLRDFGLEERFLRLMSSRNPPTIAPDQDYLNFLCRGQVTYLEAGWDKMSTDEAYPGQPFLIHYNMFMKPWRYTGVPYERYFWPVADRTPYAAELLALRESYTDARKAEDAAAGEALTRRAADIVAGEKTFLEAERELAGDPGEQPEVDWLSAAWVG